MRSRRDAPGSWQRGVGLLLFLTVSLAECGESGRGAVDFYVDRSACATACAGGPVDSFDLYLVKGGCLFLWRIGLAASDLTLSDQELGDDLSVFLVARCGLDACPRCVSEARVKAPEVQLPLEPVSQCALPRGVPAACASCVPGPDALCEGKERVTCPASGLTQREQCPVGCAGGLCSVCTPSCSGKKCGDSDGCDGTCQAGSGCCVPDCTKKICGKDQDGCGGTCQAGSGCCTPDCKNKVCGKDQDGCGGTCQAGSGCCAPDCTNKVCGKDQDGCGATCQAGSGCCTPACTNKVCGKDQDGCGATCQAGSGCCTPDCKDKVCGTDDSCGGTCQAGSGCCASAKTFHPDADRDGYPSSGSPVQACVAPTGYAEYASSKGWDCDDKDGRAHPGQTQYFTTASLGNKDYDFNCDGDEDREVTTHFTKCYASGVSCQGGGWQDYPPDCGQTGTYCTCDNVAQCYGLPPTKTTKTQACR